MYSNFFRENRAVYEIMSKNVEPEGPQIMSQYGANALHAGQARLHERMRARAHAHARGHPHEHACVRTHARTHIQVSVNYCCSMATVVSRMCFNVTLHVHWSSCCLLFVCFSCVPMLAVNWPYGMSCLHIKNKESDCYYYYYWNWYLVIPEGKAAERGLNHPPEVYLYSPSVPSWQVMGWNLPHNYRHFYHFCAAHLQLYTKRRHVSRV